MQVIGVVVVALLLSACAQTVKVTPTTLVSEETHTEGISTKVLIQVPPDAVQKLHVESGLVVLGVINDWKIDTHSSLPEAVATLFSQHYEDVVLAKSHHHSCSDCSLIVRPKITDLNVNKVSMQSSVALELPIYDAQGRHVTTLSGYGISPFLSATRVGAGVAGYFIPFLGNVIGSQVVAATVERAFDKALEDVGTKIAREANSGSLARTWLPPDLVRKKSYGQYEYTAEQVARSHGCDMRSDGLRLTEQKYHRERYQAHCWGKPLFTINCEYGRCSADEKSDLAINN